MTQGIKEQLGIAFDAMQKAGLQRVLIQFDGCGDSGQISGITYVPEKEVSSIAPVKWREYHRDYTLADNAAEAMASAMPPYKLVEEVAGEREAGLDVLLEEIVYGLLVAKHPGWEINEGSYGEFAFDAAEKKVQVQFNERVESVNTEEYSLE